MIGLFKSLARRLLPKSAAYRLASLLADWRRMRFPRHISEHSYCGQELKLHIADAMAEGWYDHDWVGVMNEIQVLATGRLKPGARVFDIGAHQAVVALLLSRVVGEAGQVVAVEADPWNAKIAEENRLLNEANNLTIIHAAAAAADSKPNHAAESGLDRVFDWSQKNICFRCLDSLAREYGSPDVVYVDVDGFEVSVLEGAGGILETRADWFVEIHVGCGLENEGGTWQEVVSFFPEDRYELLMGSDKDSAYTPFDPYSDIVTKRFYLLALSK